MKGKEFYLYIAGMATGVIMVLFSLFVADQITGYLKQDSALLPLILITMFLGMGIGGAISYGVNKLSK